MYFIAEFFLSLVLTQFSLSSPDVVEDILEVFVSTFFYSQPPNSAGLRSELGLLLNIID